MTLLEVVYQCLDSSSLKHFLSRDDLKHDVVDLQACFAAKVVDCGAFISLTKHNSFVSHQTQSDIVSEFKR